ncbi:hypothetical protein K438DRAFT_1986047 [Mycena galopus ATCC 62051]|nr:hypothetical protein K438DRAFT_1986047 [Mycena galopus ATCC 62051]
MTISRFGSINPPSLRTNFEPSSLRANCEANCEAPPSLPLRVSCDARSVYVYKDADAKLRTSKVVNLETELESEPRTPVPSDFERKMTPVPSLCVSDPANSS